MIPIVILKNFVNIYSLVIPNIELCFHTQSSVVKKIIHLFYIRLFYAYQGTLAMLSSYALIFLPLQFVKENALKIAFDSKSPSYLGLRFYI